MSTACVETRYLSLAEVAKRWGIRQPKTAARIILRHRRTAILKFSPTLHRIALRDVLDLERELRACGSIDVEGL
jgi:hypothetical protein